MRVLILLLFLCTLTSCSMVRVKPYEREILSARKMRMPRSPLDAQIDDHIHFSKEAARGGEGSGGGGCGCN